MNDSESRLRRRALAILGGMMVVFIVLSGLSFIGSRGQITPDQVTFGRYRAVEGKRDFQAYNCMGCHTIVGNGAYLGPDLTDIYGRVGPAWLAAFLPSPGTWPTAVAVSAQLQDSTIAAASKATTLNAYYAAYPDAREHIERRGGQRSYMPNLPFRSGEVGELLAFLKYTSEMNTEGWPPVPEASPRTTSSSAAAPSPPGPSAAADSAPADPAARGARLVKQVGCVACHSSTAQRLVGPGWGGLYGSEVTLTTGATVKGDSAYIDESIRDPNAKVVAGFSPGIMPSYGTVLTAEQRAEIVAYIRSLGKK